MKTAIILALAACAAYCFIACGNEPAPPKHPACDPDDAAWCVGKNVKGCEAFDLNSDGSVGLDDVNLCVLRRAK